jgi:hypothetical protein
VVWWSPCARGTLHDDKIVWCRRAWRQEQMWGYNYNKMLDNNFRRHKLSCEGFWLDETVGLVPAVCIEFFFCLFRRQLLLRTADHPFWGVLSGVCVCVFYLGISRMKIPRPDVGCYAPLPLKNILLNCFKLTYLEMAANKQRNIKYKWGVFTKLRKATIRFISIRFTSWKYCH